MCSSEPRRNSYDRRILLSIRNEARRDVDTRLFEIHAHWNNAGMRSCHNGQKDGKTIRCDNEGKYSNLESSSTKYAEEQ